MKDESLSDGVTDQLIAELTKFQSLRVTSRYWSIRFKNSSKNALEISRELGVDAMLDGTLRKVGNRIRVTTHLVNAQDGFEIWADDGFEIELSNLRDVEHQLAEAIAARIHHQLTGRKRTETG